MILRQTVDIVESLINLIPNTGTFKSYSDNGDGTFRGETCDILYLRPCSIITIDGTEYEVKDVKDDYIDFTAASAPLIFDFTAPDIHYFHGTPIATGNELKFILNTDDKVPLVYLAEVIRDRFQGPSSSIECETELRIFFLDDANFDDWLTDDHYEKAINAMTRLANLWIDVLKESGKIGLITDYDFVYYAKFGLKIDVNGSETNLFSEELSGTECRITIPILHDDSCDDYCN